MQETSSQTGRHSVRLDVDFLLREMQLRGWNQIELAKAAGISQPTVSAAVRGDAISGRSAQAIKEALDRVPPTLGDLVQTA